MLFYLNQKEKSRRILILAGFPFLRLLEKGKWLRI